MPYHHPSPSDHIDMDIYHVPVIRSGSLWASSKSLSRMEADAAIPKPSGFTSNRRPSSGPSHILVPSRCAIAPSCHGTGQPVGISGGVSFSDSGKTLYHCDTSGDGAQPSYCIHYQPDVIIRHEHTCLALQALIMDTQASAVTSPPPKAQLSPHLDSELLLISSSYITEPNWNW